VTAMPARVRPAVSDAALMGRLAAGDLTALGELYDRYGDDVRRFAHRATGHADDAEDIAHDAFLALADAGARYDDERSTRAYLLGIAAKLVLRRRRSWAQRLRNLS
jgi:RNA polymerase sigma factor (sigma-70 family)